MATLQAKICNLLGFDPNRHNWKTEVLAGITSFLTMSYILAVNPSMFGILEGMPLAYSITDGILIGIISYVVINTICGNFKKLSPGMYILAILFILKYIFL